MTTIEFNNNIVLNMPTLERQAFKFTVNQEDANDLIQDTIYKAFKYKTKFRKETNFSGWLYTIMRNTFLNNYRKKTKIQVFGDETSENFFINQTLTNQPISPDQEMYYKELFTHVEKMTEEYRVPFQMYLEGYKYEEIKDKMGLPLGTVKSRIFGARKILAAKISHYA